MIKFVIGIMPSPLPMADVVHSRLSIRLPIKFIIITEKSVATKVTKSGKIEREKRPCNTKNSNYFSTR